MSFSTKFLLPAGGSLPARTAQISHEFTVIAKHTDNRVREIIEQLGLGVTAAAAAMSGANVLVDVSGHVAQDGSYGQVNLSLTSLRTAESAPPAVAPRDPFDSAGV